MTSKATASTLSSSYELGAIAIGLAAALTAPWRAAGRALFRAGARVNFVPRARLNQLLTSHWFLTSVVENIPAMIFVKDARDLRFVRFNRAGEELLGVHRETLIGKNDYDLFPPEQADFFVRKDREVLAGREMVEIQAEHIRTAHKGERILHTKKIPIFDLSGRPSFLLGISEDITERVCAERALHDAHQQLERRVADRTAELQAVNRELRSEIAERKMIENNLERAKEELEQAGRLKDDFLAALSHELRTPLNPVLLAAEMIGRDRRLPEALKMHTEMIVRNVRVEVRLIDDLLDLTRIQRGKLQLKMERIDASSVVEEACTLCSAEARAKGLELDCQIEPELTLWGDKIRLQQVAWNLLKNAIKFTHKGGAITLRFSADGDSLSLEVRDTGIGIDPDLLPRLFDPFEQGGAPITRQFGGLGLGLAICKAIVDRHGGTIRAESAGRGSGATFRVSIPRLSDALSDERNEMATSADG